MPHSIAIINILLGVNQSRFRHIVFFIVGVTDTVSLARKITVTHRQWDSVRLLGGQWRCNCVCDLQFVDVYGNKQIV